MASAFTGSTSYTSFFNPFATNRTSADAVCHRYLLYVTFFRAKIIRYLHITIFMMNVAQTKFSCEEDEAARAYSRSSFRADLLLPGRMSEWSKEIRKSPVKLLSDDEIRVVKKIRYKTNVVQDV